jgi:hypothetical protein
MGTQRKAAEAAGVKREGCRIPAGATHPDPVPVRSEPFSLAAGSNER